MFVKAVFKAGHVGKGKYYEMTRFLVVEKVTDAVHISKMLPRVKKKPHGQALISCHPVSYEEYIVGKMAENHDPYLSYCV
jgi:hypothetical protein